MTKTSKHRIKHQAKPRALWIVNFTDEYLNSPQNFLSITPSSKGFLKEIKNYNLFKKYLILNPYKNIAEAFSGKPDFEVIQNPLLETPLSMSVHAACAFGILDGVESPKKFLNMIRSTLVENGLIFLTTSTISGFDLQVLWEKSKDIFPPDRMNLLSIEGISILLKECGFEPIELSTPGQLDVEFVKNALAKDSSIKVPRFFSYLIHHRDEFTHRFFQEFLQQNKLSSHVRIAAQKK